MLARVEAGNAKARKIIAEGREKKLKKFICRKMGESCLEMAERCEMNHKDEADKKGGKTEMHPQTPSQERSEEMKTEEAMRCRECGPKIMKKMMTECEGCGGEWVVEVYEISLVGNDGVALFNNIKSESTGKIIREEVARSTMDFEGFNVRLGLKYIAMN